MTLFVGSISLLMLFLSKRKVKMSQLNNISNKLLSLRLLLKLPRWKREGKLYLPMAVLTSYILGT